MARLLYVVTEDWYFCSHRLDLALAAREAGYEVAVVTQVTTEGERISNLGIEVIPLRFSRSGRHPLRDLQTLCSLVAVYRRLRPDLVHHVSLKPVLYGSLAARLAGVGCVVNALTGLGYVFTRQGNATRTISLLIRPALRWALLNRGHWLILQNQDDAAALELAGTLDPDRTVIIRGSGVDLERFRPVTEPQQGPPVVLLPARVLGDKGVREFVAAARQLLHKGVEARFVLAGGLDEQNPSAIPADELNGWVREGSIEWWGNCREMERVYPRAHVVCLPSYREGLPKALLEAAACGRALIATDVPGCREIVKQGENGLLVTASDPDGLAEAITCLLNNPDERKRMGKQSRMIAEREFGVRGVIERTLELYRRLLGGNGQSC